MELSAVLSLKDKLSATMDKAANSVGGMTKRVDEAKSAIAAIANSKGITIDATSNIAETVKAAQTTIDALKQDISQKEIELSVRVGDIDTLSFKEIDDNIAQANKTLNSTKSSLKDIEMAKRQLSEWTEIGLRYEDLQKAQTEVEVLEKALEQINSTNVAVRAYVDFKNDALKQIYAIDNKVVNIKTALQDKATAGIEKIKGKLKPITDKVFSPIVKVKDMATDVISKIKTPLAKIAGTVAYPIVKLKDMAKPVLDKIGPPLKAFAGKVFEATVTLKDKATAALGKVVSGITKGLGIGIAAAGTAMAGLTVKALNLGGELEQNLGGSEAVFKNFATTMQETGKTAFSSMGLSQTDFLATANKMGALFQGSGFGIKESADLSARSMQRASDVASIMGVDVESAMEAVAGAAKGNFTMMDNLGVAMNDTAIGAYAMSKGIKKSTSDMTQQEKIGLAMEMFLDKTAYAAGNYAKENDTLAGSLTTAKAALSNFLTGSGDVDALVSSFLNLTNIIIDRVSEILPRLATGLVTGIGQLIGKLPALLNQLLPVLLNTGIQLMNSLIGMLQQNTQMLADLAVTLITRLATFLLQAIPQIILIGVEILMALASGISQQLPTLVPLAIQAIMTIVNGLIASIDTLIVAAISIINGLIDGLIQNLPLLISAALQLLLAIVTSLLNNIQLIINCALNLVDALVTGLIQNLPMLLQCALQLILGIVEGLVSNINLIIDGAIALVNGLIDGILNNLPMIIQTAIQVVLALAGGLIKAIPQLVAAIPRLIVAIIETILTTNWLEVGWEIIKGIFVGLWEGAKSLFTGIWDGIKGLFGKGGKDAGKAASDGVEEGLTGNAPSVNSAATNVANGITTNMMPNMTTISGYGTTANNNLATGITNSSMLPSGAAGTVATNTSLAFGGATNTTGFGMQASSNLAAGINSNSFVATSSATTLANNTKMSMAGVSDTTQMGSDLSNNLAAGINSNSTNAITAASTMSSQVESAANSDVVVNVIANAEGLQTFSGALQGIVASATESLNQLPAIAGGAMNSMADAFTNGVAKLNETMCSGISSMQSFLQSVSLYTTGQNIMEGLNRGMLSKKQSLITTAKTIATSISKTINDSLQIRSPSRVMMKSGRFTGEGLVIGIGEMVNKVRAAAANMGEALKNPFDDKPKPKPIPVTDGGGYGGLTIAQPIDGEENSAIYNSNSSTSSSNKSKRVTIQNLIGSVVVQNEADEDRLVDKIMAKLADEIEEADDNMGEEDLD